MLGTNLGLQVLQDGAQVKQEQVVARGRTHLTQEHDDNFDLWCPRAHF